MKKTLKIILSFVVLISSFTSCEKDNGKDPLFEYYQVENMAPYVRVIIDNPLLDSSQLNSASITFMVSTPVNNVTSWSLSVRQIGSNTTEYANLKTVTSFPETFTYTASELAAAIGVDLEDILPADEFQFSGVSVGTDGRTLTANDLGPDLFGQPEQHNAYDFSVVVFCAPTPNPVGDWTLDMIDLYGDGWDGAFITATINGSGTDYTVVSGSGASFVVTVAAGSSLVWSYSSGAFEEEHVFTMTAPDGTVYGPFDGGVGIPFCFL